ncbi:nuclear transport factor 2 family protein [Flavobacterium sp. GCM10023249]|uniref:nuclear transport factor 2 family protein n=1 Tax=unclassified Flavobacterium TaxID=196869 RepID=UPI0036186E52
MKQFLTFLFVVLILFSCNNKKASNSENGNDKISEFDLNVVKLKIQKKTKLFTEAHIKKDTIYLNNSFCQDAKVFPPNSEIVNGIKAISKLNSDWVNYGVYEFKEETTSFYGNQDYVIDEGNYYLVYGKEKTVDKGKYINIWRNVNGEWKICSNIWNTNLPAQTSESE